MEQLQKQEDIRVQGAPVDLSQKGECKTGVNQVIAPEELQRSEYSIEVLGTDVILQSKAEGVTLDDIMAAKKAARFPNVAVFPRDQYYSNKGENTDRISKSQFPYKGDVVVVDVNLAG